MSLRRVYYNTLRSFKKSSPYYLIVFLLPCVVTLWSPGVTLEHTASEPDVWVLKLSPSPRLALADRSKKKYDRVGLFTAYTSRECETDGDPYITADGTDLRKIRHCVIANDKLKFGTLVEIEGIGQCDVRDRFGKGHSESRFDIYFKNELKKALKFGKKKLKYRIVEHTQEARVIDRIRR